MSRLVGSLTHLEKRYLFTPGPTPVPPEVLAAGAEPIVHHRGPDFREIYASTLSRLKDVYRTEADVLLFSASGTGAMESAVANLCAPGDRVAVVSHGSFGERCDFPTFATCQNYIVSQSRSFCVQNQWQASNWGVRNDRSEDHFNRRFR